jgi:ABC-type multidrug transport system fused ATPase/permease subunit
MISLKYHQARITLARAIYSNAQTLLLDDVLAALDVHTAKWIVDKCFQGDLVKGRTLIIVVCRHHFLANKEYMHNRIADP